MKVKANSPANRQRALRIWRAARPEYEGSLSDLLIDLLADARHLADRAGLNFANVDLRAHNNYLADLDEG